MMVHLICVGCAELSCVRGLVDHALIRSVRPRVLVGLIGKAHGQASEGVYNRGVNGYEWVDCCDPANYGTFTSSDGAPRQRQCTPVMEGELELTVA